MKIRRRCRTNVSVLLLAVVGGVFSAKPVAAQNGRDLLGGLLRGLVESQMERQEQKRRVEIDVPKFPSRRQTPAPIEVRMSPEIDKAMGYCKSFSAESDRLARSLQRDAHRVPGVRSQLDKVLKLKERTALMNTRLAQQDRALAIEQIQSLDRDWRMAAYSLNQLPGLSRDCRDSIERLDGLSNQCCKLFDIGPQLDRREVMRLADSLAAEFHHLERDVEFELRQHRDARTLIMQLRRTEARAKLLSDSVAEGEAYDLVVAEFKQLVNEWNRIDRTVSAFNDRHIDRTVEQIHEITRALHEQFWLPLDIDREHLQRLASATATHVSVLTDTLSLSMLVAIPDGQAVLAAAQAMNEETVHLAECIASGSPAEDIAEHWQELSKAWRKFDRHTAAIDSPQIRATRQEITAHIETMRHTLGIELIFDRREVVRCIAELEGVAEQAQFHIAQWQRRPGAQVDANMIRAAKAMIQKCHHLHEECAGDASREHLARDCQEMARDWIKLQPQLLACKTIDRNTLIRLSDEATTHLIHLQTLLE